MSPETLFSLELVIDYVRFDCNVTRGNVLDPAVGLRFLDFPTLLVHKYKEDPYVDNTPDEARSQKQNKHFFFHKGKSCLFKINLDSLHNHLSNAPLYVMVLDVKEQVPKFIGSSLISLAKVMERIKLDIDERGIGTPSAHREKSITPLCNLMGTAIGTISLAYKITSLGENLIPRVPYDKVALTHGKREQEPKESAGVLNIDTDDEEPHHKTKSAAFTQTEPTKDKAYSKTEHDNTTFCPPPLFYSSSVHHENVAEKCKNMSNVEMESLNIEDPEEDVSDDHHDRNTSEQRRRITEPASPGDVIIRQLPLLNALLNELSLLSNQTRHRQPLSVHPNLAWSYAPAPESHPAPSPGTKPKSEHQKTPQKKVQSKTKVSPSAKNASKREEKPRSTRKLTYGLTNTFHLRLQQVKSAETKRRNQNKEKKRRLPAHKPTDKLVKTGVNLDISELKPRENATSMIKTPKDEVEPTRKIQVRVPSRYSDCSDPRPVRSSNKTEPGSDIANSCSDKKKSSTSSLAREYQDDFTSLDGTVGFSPETMSSPEPNRRRRYSGLSEISNSESKVLPVPMKAENSPQRSFKSTRVIRPRPQTSALSLSSDDSEDGSHQKPGSEISGGKTPSVRRTFGRSESFETDPDGNVTFGGISVDSVTDKSVPRSFSHEEELETTEEQDQLGSLGLDENYHHISELMINKLPGYTL